MNSHKDFSQSVRLDGSAQSVSAAAQLIEILQNACQVRIASGSESGEADGYVFFEDRRFKDELPTRRRATLSLASSAEAPKETDFREVSLRFTADQSVPFPFRGSVVCTQVASLGESLTPGPDERVLAQWEGGPIWTVRVVDGVEHFKSAVPLVPLGAHQGFSEVFCGERFFNNLPLLHFLRDVISVRRHELPPLRAAFMFDDPNLHWHSYGLVNYSDIAAQAARENYHVSFATIPLDSWYTNSTAAGLFRSNSRFLSLLVHGNNHSKQELTTEYSLRSRAAFLAQANQRVMRLEQKAGLKVSRVMVPPHGACSDMMLAALPAAGFEAACISSGSLRAHNPGKPWTRALGFMPCEMIEDCPVLPRWGLGESVSSSHGTVLVAAYLGRPIIFRGHHRDLKRGIEILDEYARFINRLGHVHWGNMSDLSRMSYQYSVKGDTCHLQLLSHQVVFDAPPHCRTLIIESTDTARSNSEYVVRQGNSLNKARVGEPIELRSDRLGDTLLEIGLDLGLPHADPSGLPRTSPSLILRRLLTEGRDRLHTF